MSSDGGEGNGYNKFYVEFRVNLKFFNLCLKYGKSNYKAGQDLLLPKVDAMLFMSIRQKDYCIIHVGSNR